MEKTHYPNNKELTFDPQHEDSDIDAQQYWTALRQIVFVLSLWRSLKESIKHRYTYDYKAMFDADHPKFDETINNFRIALRPIIVNILANLEREFNDDEIEELIEDTFFEFFKQRAFKYTHDSAMFRNTQTIASRNVDKRPRPVALDEERDAAPNNDIVRAEHQADLQNLYRHLNEEQVFVIKGRLINKLFRQIAEEIGMTEEKVKSIFYYAIRKLQDIVKNERLAEFEYLDDLYTLEQADIDIIKARLDGKSFDQIGKDMDIPSDDVFAKYQAGIRKLRGDE